MKTLIVEDDLTSRLLLQHLLAPYGECHVAVNGKEAVQAVSLALDINQPYDLVCLDIMMPEMDGQTALREIRLQEGTRFVRPSEGAKIVMTTALGDVQNVATAYSELCDDYLVKPIDKEKLTGTLRTLGLVS